MKLISNIKKKTYMKRKVLIFSFFIALYLPTMVNAQIGVKAGSTISSFYYTGSAPIPYDGYEIDFRPYLGYDVEFVQINPQQPLISTYISVFKRFKLTNRLGFQPELCFSQKGVDFSYSKYENIVYKVIINYLETPISLSYQYLQKENILSHFYIGGYGAYKIHAIKKVASHNTPVEITKLNSVKNLDYGVHVGVDFKYKINIIFHKLF